MTDSKSPHLSSLEISTPVVEFGLGDASIRFTANANDDLSGIDEFNGGWASPSGDQTLYMGAYEDDVMS